MDFWLTDAYMLAQDGPGCFDTLRTAFWRFCSQEIITSGFFRTCGDKVQYSFGIMFTDAVLDYQLEHGEDRVLTQLDTEP